MAVVGTEASKAAALAVAAERLVAVAGLEATAATAAVETARAGSTAAAQAVAGAVARREGHALRRKRSARRWPPRSRRASGWGWAAVAGTAGAEATAEPEAEDWVVGVRAADREEARVVGWAGVAKVAAWAAEGGELDLAGKVAARAGPARAAELVAAV